MASAISWHTREKARRYPSKWSASNLSSRCGVRVTRYWHVLNGCSDGVSCDMTILSMILYSCTSYYFNFIPTNSKCFWYWKSYLLSVLFGQANTPLVRGSRHWEPLRLQGVVAILFVENKKLSRCSTLRGCSNDASRHFIKILKTNALLAPRAWNEPYLVPTISIIRESWMELHKPIDHVIAVHRPIRPDHHCSFE